MEEAQADARRVRFPIIFWLLVALSALCIGVGAWWLATYSSSEQASAPPPVAVAQAPAVDFQLGDLDGRQVRLSDLRGQVVLLNFWATWCPPCKAEMPDLQALYRDQGAAHRFVVVGVDVEEDRAVTQAFARQFGLSFPLLVDSAGQVSNDHYGIRALPTSLIIDRDGKVRYRWTGQQSRSAMQQMLAKVW
jgi:peroxiredoxin